MMKNLLNEASLSDIFRTVVYIILTTFIIEGIGVYLVYVQVQDVVGIDNKLFFACFMAFRLSVMRDSPRCRVISMIL